MAKTKLTNSESDIQKAILDYLTYIPHCFAWRNHSGGIYDPTRKIFRTNTGLKGVSDILGIYKGKPLAIEVKSKRGIATSIQKDFIKTFKMHGGIAFVARSIEDVKRELGIGEERC